MADSILRLKVDSQEYDNKLKRAAEGLQRYAEGCRKAGGTLTQLDEGVEQFVKELGKMETTSNSARGKINEMTKAFTELSVQYNKLTDEEKASPFGKALSESLNTLKGRIQEGKTELDDINKSLNGGGGLKDALDQVAGKFGLNIDMVTKFGGVVGVTTTALKVAKDAFFNNEQMLDEWGRTVESAESVYKGFLNSLNTGDISGFLSNINTITQAARDAYDALDELATFTAFNKANVAGARADLTGAIADYREGTGGKDAVSEASEKLIKELETKQKLQSEAYKKVIAKVAAERNVNADDLLKVMQGNYGSFKELKDLEYTGKKTRIVSAGGTFASGPVMQTITEAVPANERERLAQAVKHLNDTEIDNFQSIAEAAKMTQVEINNQRKMVARVLNGKQGGSASGGGGRSGGGSGTNAPTYAADSIAAQQALVSDLTKKWNEAGEGVRDVYLRSLIGAESKLKQMKDEQALLKEQMQGRLLGGNVELPIKAGAADSIVQTFDQIRTELAKNPIVIPIQTTLDDVKKIQDTARTTAKVVGTIGQAFNAIEDPAAKVAGTVAQAIATVALAYSQTLAQDKTTKSNIWAFIAAAAASTISMVETIASIHSATGYANGGEIKGNSYSGDNIPIMANAGEIILNRAQQSNVASGLQGAGSLRGLNLRTKVKGTELLVWLDNSLAQSGRGELVTWGQ